MVFLLNHLKRVWTELICPLTFRSAGGAPPVREGARVRAGAILRSALVARRGSGGLMAPFEGCQDVVRFAQSEKPCEKEVNGESAATQEQQPTGGEQEGALASWSRKELTCCVHQAANSCSQNTGNEQ